MDETEGEPVRAKHRRWRKSKEERQVEKERDESQLEVRWNLSKNLFSSNVVKGNVYCTACM